MDPKEYTLSNKLEVFVKDGTALLPTAVISSVQWQQNQGQAGQVRLPTGLVIPNPVEGTPGTLNLNIIPGGKTRALNLLDRSARGDGSAVVVIRVGDYKQVFGEASGRTLVLADDQGGPGDDASGVAVATFSGIDLLNNVEIKAAQKVVLDQGGSPDLVLSLDNLVSETMGWLTYLGVADAASTYVSEQEDQSMRDLDAITAATQFRLVEHRREFEFAGEVIQGAGFSVADGTPSDQIQMSLDGDPDDRLIINDL